MNYRNTVVLATEAMAASGTKIIDIDLMDVVSRISIDFYGVNGTSVPTAHPAKMVSSVELIDGSDVLWALSAPEALALMFYQNKRTPFCINNYSANAWCRFVLDINFGRSLYDKQLAFDPKKFRNPQLKITYSRASGGSAPASGGFKVMADVFDQKEVAPIGFLSAKEVLSYVPTASANEYIDLPTDRTLRSLLVFARKLKAFPIGDVDEVKLSEDNDKRTVIDDKRSQILKNIGNLYPRIEENWYKYGSAALETCYCMCGYEGAITAICQDILTATHQASQPSDGYFQHAGASGQAVHGIINGLAPFGSLILPFGDPQDIADWYDVSKIGKLQLRLKAGSGVTADSTCEVVTEQLREYGAA